MSNPNPSPATRWKPGMRVSRGPGKTQWLRGLLDQKFDKLPFTHKLNLCLRYGDESLRYAMAARLLEIAFTDQVVVIGRDGDGPIERVSSRESIEAIKVLYSYDLGTPPRMEKELPAIEVPANASLLDVAMQIYRAKLSAGEMTEPELSEMVRLLLAAEKDKALIFLKALGSKLQTLQSQQIDRLLAAYEQDPAGFLGFVSAKVPEPDAMEVTPVAPIEEVAPVVAKEAKRAVEEQAVVQDVVADRIVPTGFAAIVAESSPPFEHNPAGRFASDDAGLHSDDDEDDE